MPKLKCTTLYLQLYKSISSTISVNRESFKIIGYTTVDDNFGTNSGYSVQTQTRISVNFEFDIYIYIQGKDFISTNI